MPLDLEPFALLCLETHSGGSLVGHLLITPWQMAFISTTTERVADYSRLLAPHGDARVRAALIECARWPLPLILEPEDEVYALATSVAPSATRIEVIAVNLSSASYGGLINTLIAWRTADMVPTWPEVIAAMHAVASSRCGAPLRAIEERGLDDTPLFTLTTAAGDPIATMALWPSLRRLQVWAYHDGQDWIERVYWSAADDTWRVRGSDGTVLRSLPAAVDLARDALNPEAEDVASSRATALTTRGASHQERQVQHLVPNRPVEAQEY